MRLVLARTETLAVALVDAIAYSTGFTLRLALRIHHEAEDVDPRQVMMQLHGGPMGSTDERLRFGIEFADGRKATNLEPRRPRSDEPPEIGLSPYGGSGGGGRNWQVGYWVYPLPPPGALTIGIAWPARGIDEHTETLDAQPIVDAASDSIVLWEDNRPVRSAGPSSVAQSGSSQIEQP